MILPFDYIGYKRLSENKCFPNHRWYSNATWGKNGWMFSIRNVYKHFDMLWNISLNLTRCLSLLLFQIIENKVNRMTHELTLRPCLKSSQPINPSNIRRTAIPWKQKWWINVLNKSQVWVNDYCLTPIQQFLSYIMSLILNEMIMRSALY